MFVAPMTDIFPKPVIGPDLSLHRFRKKFLAKRGRVLVVFVAAPMAMDMTDEKELSGDPPFTAHFPHLSAFHEA